MAENNVGSRVVQQIRRDEVTGNITSMPIHEDVITSTNKSVIALREICDEWKRVKVKDENDKPLTEVFSIEEITDKSKYFVDYDYSNVYFHIDVAGKLMKLDYYGIGSEYLSYTAVFTKLDKYGNVIETLADIIDGGKEIIETVKIFGGVTNVLQTLKTKITEGNQVIAKAQEKVNNLSSVVDKIDNMEIGGRNLWIDSKVSFTGGVIED